MSNEEIEVKKGFIPIFTDYCQWTRENVPESKLGI